MSNLAHDDAASEMAESTGYSANRTTVRDSDVDDTFGNIAGFRSMPQSPNVHLAFPGNEIEGISENSSESDNSPIQPSQANSRPSPPYLNQIIFNGIDDIGRRYYHPLAVAPIPPPLDVRGIHATGDNGGLEVERKYELNALSPGPGGNGVWHKAYFQVPLVWPYNVVRRYRDNLGTYIWKFILIETTQTGIDDSHPVGADNASFRDDLDRGQVRQPLTQINVANMFNRPNGQQPPMTRAQSRQAARAPVIAPAVEQESQRQQMPRSQGHEAPASSYEQMPAIPGHYDPFAADRELVRRYGASGNARAAHSSYGNSGAIPSPTAPGIFVSHTNPISGGLPHPYYTPPMQHNAASTFHTIPPTPTGGAGGGAGTVPFNQQQNAPAGQGTMEIFTMSEPAVTFQLKALTLKDVYDFHEQVVSHNIHYQNPRQHYKVSKAITPGVLKSALSDSTLSIEDVSKLDSMSLLRLLKDKVLPKGSNRMLVVFQSDDVLKFKKSYEYDIRDHAIRLDYLRDIQTFLADCQQFFVFLTADVSQEVTQYLPAMRSKTSKENGLIEITLNKIPGINGDTKYNYARSIVNSRTYKSYFEVCYKDNVPILWAYPKFIETLKLLLNTGINNVHYNMEENLLYDQSLKSSLKHLSFGTLADQASKQLAEKQALYAERRKAHKLNVHTEEPRSASSKSQADDNYFTDNDDSFTDIDDPCYDQLYHIFDAGIYAMQAPENEKKVRTESFAKALESADKYARKRGEEGYIGTLPTICLRWIRTNKCNTAQCKYSHQWKDYLEFAHAIQADYRRVKDRQGSEGNHPAKQSLAQPVYKPYNKSRIEGTPNKLQHITCEFGGRDEGHDLGSDDQEDNYSSESDEEDYYA